jgi:hypothetical protein
MSTKRKLDDRQRRRIRAYAGVVVAVVAVGSVLVLLLVYEGELSTTAYIVFGGWSSPRCSGQPSACGC